MTKALLRNAILRQRPSWANLADFEDRLEENYPRVMADLEDQLDGEGDPFILATTQVEATAPEITDEVVDTTVGDTAILELLPAARKVYGDSIFVFDPSSDDFLVVPRMSFDELVLSGDDEIVAAFEEMKGLVNVYFKQGTFTLPTDVHYRYNRALDVELDSDGDVLDIRNKDFSFVVQRMIEYIGEGLTV
jgi:hypothetical protein